jgi:hypothetical protein
MRLAEARVSMGIEASTERFPAKYDRAERRCHARIALDEPVRGSVPEEGKATLSGRFVNVSANGLKITMTRSLNAGVIVKVEYGNHVIVGEVRRSQAGLAGYAIGIVISEWIDNQERAAGLDAADLESHSRLTYAASRIDPRAVRPYDKNARWSNDPTVQRAFQGDTRLLTKSSPPRGNFNGATAVSPLSDSCRYNKWNDR